MQRKTFIIIGLLTLVAVVATLALAELVLGRQAGGRHCQDPPRRRQRHDRC